MSTPEAIRSCLDVLERGAAASATRSWSAGCGPKKRGFHFHHFPRPKTLGASKLDSLPWGDLGQDWPASK